VARGAERTVSQSVLDRLIDDDPGVRADPPRSWAESVQELRAAVRRDLEWLLNTRRIVEPAPDTFVEVQQSVYHFGLPDLSSLGADSRNARARLLRQVEECIRIFEPRLTGVRVSAVEAKGEGRHQLRFVIEGMLRMDPDPEHVVFDSVLETVSGKFQLAGGADE
jgi:type VI secretion system protein ImpF